MTKMTCFPACAHCHRCIEVEGVTSLTLLSTLMRLITNIYIIITIVRSYTGKYYELVAVCIVTSAFQASALTVIV